MPSAQMSHGQACRRSFRFILPSAPFSFLSESAEKSPPCAFCYCVREIDPSHRHRLSRFFHPAASRFSFCLVRFFAIRTTGNRPPKSFYFDQVGAYQIGGILYRQVRKEKLPASSPPPPPPPSSLSASIAAAPPHTHHETNGYYLATSARPPLVQSRMGQRSVKTTISHSHTHILLHTLIKH